MVAVFPVAWATTAQAAVVTGYAWHSSGEYQRSGPSGTVVSVYATGLARHVQYRLVSASPDPNASVPCGRDRQPINDNIRTSSNSGFIGLTSGRLNRPVGRWEICFSEVTPGSEGRTVSFPVQFRVAPGPSLVSVSGRQLLVRARNADGTLGTSTPFTMRGVGYSPASAGTSTSPSDPNNANVRRQEFNQWYATDVPLLAAMKANTVRLFIDPGNDAALGPAGLDFLDALYRAGIFVVMTIDDGYNLWERGQQVVAYYRDHPAILMWSLGSEWNENLYFGRYPTVDEAIAATQNAALRIKEVDSAHPVASSLGDVAVNSLGRRLADTQNLLEQVPAVDVWSLNVYRGSNFGGVFEQWESISSKPMFIGEFGTDAWRATLEAEQPPGTLDEAMQAEWDLKLWNDLARNLSARDPSRPAIGGAVFEFNDEWWKFPPAGSQQTGGQPFPSWSHPDGLRSSEEYFGIATIGRTPRQAHTRFQTAFAPGYTPPGETHAFRVTSRGYRASEYQYQLGIARFFKSAALMHEQNGGAGGGRGIQVAVIDTATGRLTGPVRIFDTWEGRATGVEWNTLADYLEAIPNGRLVMLAVADEAGITDYIGDGCTELPTPGVQRGLQVLEALGSTRIRDYCYGDSWAMVTVKGQGARGEQVATAAEASATGSITVP
ncbi:MAG: interleukin-like EMT inducer domain-containing protein [Acidimicrobiales bacterium]